MSIEATEDETGGNVSDYSRWFWFRWRLAMWIMPAEAENSYKWAVNILGPVARSHLMKGQDHE